MPQYRAGQDLIIRGLHLELDQHAALFSRSPVEDFKLEPLDSDQLHERKQALLKAGVLSKQSPPSTSGRTHSPLSNENEVAEVVTSSPPGSPKANGPNSFRFKLPEKSTRILSRPQSPQSPRTPEMGRLKISDSSLPKSFSNSHRQASQGSLYQSPGSSPGKTSQGSLYQNTLGSAHKSQGSLYQGTSGSPHKSQESLYQSAMNSPRLSQEPVWQFKIPEGSRPRQSLEGIHQKVPKSLGSSHPKNSQSLGSSNQISSQRKSSGSSQSGKSGSLQGDRSTSSQLEKMEKMENPLYRTSGSTEHARTKSSHSTIRVPTQKHDAPNKVQCKAGVKPTICEYCKKQYQHWANVVKRKPTMVTTAGAAAGVSVQTVGTALDHKNTEIVGGTIVATSLGCLAAIQAYEQEHKQTYAEHHPDADAERRKYLQDRKRPMPKHGAFSAFGDMMRRDIKSSSLSLKTIVRS